MEVLRGKDSSDKRSTNLKAEITQEHIDMVMKISRYMAGRFQGDRSLDEIEHDALWGLYKAWESWKEEIPFQAYAAKVIRWYILKGGQKQFSHRTVGIEAIEYTARDNLDLQILVQNRIEISQIVRALSKERDIVRDAVLKLGNDEEIARRYNRKSSNSIVQIRNRFIRDFLEAYNNGIEYRSRGRNTGPKSNRETVDCR